MCASESVCMCVNTSSGNAVTTERDRKAQELSRGTLGVCIVCMFV